MREKEDCKKRLSYKHHEFNDERNILQAIKDYPNQALELRVGTGVTIRTIKHRGLFGKTERNSYGNEDVVKQRFQRYCESLGLTCSFYEERTDCDKKYSAVFEELPAR